MAALKTRKISNHWNLICICRRRLYILLCVLRGTLRIGSYNSFGKMDIHYSQSGPCDILYELEMQAT